MKKKVISAFILTLVLLFYLLSQINIVKLIVFLLSISVKWVFVGFLFYTLSMLLRTLRFKILLKNKIKFNVIFPIVCFHFFFNNLLPAKTGEMTYVYLSKKIGKIPVGEGVATLVIARILDFISVTLFFLVAAILMVKKLPGEFSDVLFFIPLVLFISVMILAMLIHKGMKFAIIFENVMKRVGISDFGIIKFSINKLKDTAKSFNIVGKRDIIYSFILSLCIWLFLFLMIYILTVGMGMNLGIGTIIFVSAVPVFITILPIQGFGGFGTYEGSWAIALISFGFSKEIAILSGFGVHAIYLIYSLIFVIIGFFFLREISNPFSFFFSQIIKFRKQ